MSRCKKLPIQREVLILFVLQGAGTDGVYGLDIQRAVEQCSDGHEKVSHGSLYALLGRLRTKGYIDSYSAPAPAGGAARHYYFLTGDGEAYVSSIGELLGRLQDWLPK